MLRAFQAAALFGRTSSSSSTLRLKTTARATTTTTTTTMEAPTAECFAALLAKKKTATRGAEKMEEVEEEEGIEKCFRFEVVHESKRSGARLGLIHTPHGTIQTPAFVAVATNAALKFQDHRLVTNLPPVVTGGTRAAAAATTTAAAEEEEKGGGQQRQQQQQQRQHPQQVMFSNTYHLLLQPGLETVRRAGGLHKFMNYEGPLMTDSGGFQVFSLRYGGVTADLQQSLDGQPQKTPTAEVLDFKRSHISGLKRNNNNNNNNNNSKKTSGGQLLVKKVTEEGITFRSYRDGSLLTLSPESSVQAQKVFGADIIIPLDELLPYNVGEKELVASLERTHRWEARSLLEHLRAPQKQAMYGVIHGGINKTLRQLSTRYLVSLPFDGFAIGGSIGKNRDEMRQVLSWICGPDNNNNTTTTPTDLWLPRDKPRHLLGIGDPESILQTASFGMDTYDSAYPTRAARHGTALLVGEAEEVIASVVAAQQGTPSSISFFTEISSKEEEKVADSMTLVGDDDNDRTQLQQLNKKGRRKNNNKTKKNEGRFSLFSSEAREMHDRGIGGRSCGCYCCTHFSAAYVAHLFRAHEPLGPQLLVNHNLWQTNRLMHIIRTAIQSNLL